MSPHNTISGEINKDVPTSGDKPTPPPVPSEIEEEIRKILQDNIASQVYYESRNSERILLEGLRKSEKALISLYTHHTSEKVRKERERIRGYIKNKMSSDGEDIGCTVQEGGTFDSSFYNGRTDAFEEVLSIITAQAAEGEGEL